jgi:hypothetical protein
MGLLVEDFERRTAEVKQLFALVEQVSKDSDPLSSSSAHPIYRDDLSVKILKATVFLVLYNVVEATVRSCFSSLWSAVEGEDVKLCSLIGDLRGVWLKHEFRRIDPFSASGKTYRDLAERIMEFSILDGVPRVGFRQLSGGGNWGVDEIREICVEHGLNMRTPRAARAGVDLNTVRDRRNDLAHGTLSFEEVGQAFTVEELRSMLARSLSTLRALVTCSEQFLDSKGYLST